MTRFPAPWTVDEIPGGCKVLEGNGQALAYVYCRSSENADAAKALSPDETRPIVFTIDKLPELLSR